MAEITRWWCQLFGYADCHAASTFESILLVGAALIGGLIAFLAAAFIFVMGIWAFLMIFSHPR